MKIKKSRLIRILPKRYDKVSGRSALTLIELAVVTAMLSIISLAIYANFNSGIKLWQVVNKDLPEEEINILFDKFTFDIKNSIRFKNIRFIGQVDKVEFATILDSPELGNRSVGKVVYLYDDYSKVLSRIQKDYSQVYSDRKGLVRELVRGVDSLRFRYYLYDRDIKKYIWQDYWDTDRMPLAVRISIKLSEGSKVEGFVKTVSLPIST